MRLNVLCVAFLLVVLAAWPAGAQRNGTAAIETKTRAAVLAVSIDKKLKFDPALVANLAAEGRRFVAKMRAEADDEYKSDQGYFRGGRRYSYQRGYAFRSLVAGRYLSIVRDDSTYTGGAHPNSRLDTILWDSAQKKRISVRPFFNETADDGPTMTALAALVRRAVTIERQERREGPLNEIEKKEFLAKLDETIAKDEQLKETIQPRLLKLGPISLAPSTTAGKSSGLTLHFSPYDVDAYAAGPYTVFVPWTDLKPFLSAEGIAIFAGDRPAKDNEL
ncbi:MAG: DUF3298 and DUF4163 domain-containing protein [Xanthobacteraceae bacterium]|nr:DUF3298 and DUF4163 domain-containing protein [Xanthobacteraceae bacterium]